MFGSKLSGWLASHCLAAANRSAADGALLGAGPGGLMPRASNRASAGMTANQTKMRGLLCRIANVMRKVTLPPPNYGLLPHQP